MEGGDAARVIAYPPFTGTLAPGRRVWLNTTAVELGLGTGGAHLVLAPVPDIEEPSGSEIGETPTRAVGHLMKLRYTPLQHAVLAVEEEVSPHRAGLQQITALEGLPVLVAELHSMAMAGAVAARGCGARRVVYVMTDGAALPLAVSRLAARLKEAGVLAGTITSGQAFGGDLEAVTVASSLAAARAVFDADCVVVSQGPGNAGTGSQLGFSGLAQADHLHAAAALGARPVAALRVSFADPRPRHRGLSHHSATVLGRMVLARVAAAVPELPGECADLLAEQIEAAGLPGRHELRLIPADDLWDLLIEHQDQLTTMGRSLEEERAFFLSACAAARLALEPEAGCDWPRRA